jgi:CheY-like chemotaxis protein
VIACSSGGEVRRALSQHLRQPDLIVADYWLDDGETGLAVIQELRRDAEIGIPAIILTADRDMALTVNATAHDIAFLQKPANAQRIRRTAMELMPQSGTVEHQTLSSE